MYEQVSSYKARAIYPQCRCWSATRTSRTPCAILALTSMTCWRS